MQNSSGFMLVKGRWPNTAHWQRIVATFREIAGPRWRTTAANWGGVERRDLRSSADIEMTSAELAVLDSFMISSLESHIRDLDKRRSRAIELILEIQRAGYDRVTSEAVVVNEPGVLDARPFIEWYWRTFFAEETADEPKMERTPA
jgi:hypothetical protein